jgi:hypothetical protein
VKPQWKLQSTTTAGDAEQTPMRRINEGDRVPATTVALSSTAKGLVHYLIWPRWVAVACQSERLVIGT